MKSSLLGWEALLNFDRVFKQFLYIFLLFEIAMTYEDIMAASLEVREVSKSKKSYKNRMKTRSEIDSKMYLIYIIFVRIFVY